MYVEGRALHPVERLWLPHAWLALPSGRVVDLTWGPPGLAYLGVALESGVVRRAMLRLGRIGPVLPLVVGHVLAFAVLALLVETRAGSRQLVHPPATVGDS